MHKSEALFTPHQCTNKENMVYVHTMEYYSVLKIRDVLLFVATWIDLKDMQSKISQAQCQG